MPTKRIVFGTICSRAKADGEYLMPAHTRYRGTHVARVHGMAQSAGCDFYILSGVYGLIPAHNRIIKYDEPLQPEFIECLAHSTVLQQLARLPADELHFYMESRHWELGYLDVLIEAKKHCAPNGLTLCFIRLDDRP